MGSYFHVIERKVGGNLDAFRRELGRLRESGHFHRDCYPNPKGILRDEVI